MSRFLANWQTSLPGFALLAQAIYVAVTTKTIDWSLVQQGLVGIGLINAKDWNVTGGTKSV